MTIHSDVMLMLMTILMEVMLMLMTIQMEVMLMTSQSEVMQQNADNTSV